MSRNHEYISPELACHQPLGFASLRKCRCGSRLLTTGNGVFRCDRCGFRDKQNLDKLRGKGLDYSLPARENMEKMSFVSRGKG